MLESKDDNELLGRLSSGDYEAFSSLYNKYVASLTNYGLKFTDDVNTVHDCLHDIFVSIWTRRENFTITSSFKSYLIKSVRSSIVQKVNRNRKVYSITGDNESNYEFNLSLSPEDTFLANENTVLLFESIQQLLSKLTAKQKEVIYLRYYHDLSF